MRRNPRQFPAGMHLRYLSRSDLVMELGSRRQNQDLDTEKFSCSRGGLYALEIGTRKSHDVMPEAAVGGGLGTLHLRKIKSWLVLPSGHFIPLGIDTVPSIRVYVPICKCVFS